MGQVGLGNDLAEAVAFGHEGHEDEASKFRHLLTFNNYSKKKCFIKISTP